MARKGNSKTASAGASKARAKQIRKGFEQSSRTATDTKEKEEMEEPAGEQTSQVRIQDFAEVRAVGCSFDVLRSFCFSCSCLSLRWAPTSLRSSWTDEQKQERRNACQRTRHLFQLSPAPPPLIRALLTGYLHKTDYVKNRRCKTRPFRSQHGMGWGGCCAASSLQRPSGAHRILLAPGLPARFFSEARTSPLLAKHQHLAKPAGSAQSDSEGEHRIV